MQKMKISFSGNNLMVLWGTLVNVVAIIIGVLCATVLFRVSDRVNNCILQGLGLGVTVLGISMGLKSSNFLFVIISLVTGAVIGELIGLEQKLLSIGNWLEHITKRYQSGEGRDISRAFMTATLLYCVGAMAILGALDSGIRQDHTILYTKSILDGISAMIFAGTLGFGVIFSAIPVLLYQGSIALSASLITSFISTEHLNLVISEITSVGGILIFGIGLNILHIKKINVVNLLPSVMVITIIVVISMYFG
ncbi:hypothetical protein CHISP_1845 [Chitinispirillum alkaliphilum]|nr:hypothetical protein CHISP_1845 [Chitinispirillum alkaliphilum]